jgi:hypothetical protein
VGATAAAIHIFEEVLSVPAGCNTGSSLCHPDERGFLYLSQLTAQALLRSHPLPTC